MSHSPVACRAVAAMALVIVPLVSLSAQGKQPPAKLPPAATDSGKMDHGKMDHGAMHGAKPGAKAESWKELDAYHMLMMAAWHPAKDKSDLAPIRAKAAEMVAAAKVLAASKAPAGCHKPALLEAQAAMPAETEKVAALVTRKATDAQLKNALATLHEKFEALGDGCNTGMKHDMKH